MLPVLLKLNIGLIQKNVTTKLRTTTKNVPVTIYQSHTTDDDPQGGNMVAKNSASRSYSTVQ